EQPEPDVRAADLRPSAANDGLRLRASHGAGATASALPHDRPDAPAEVQRHKGPRADPDSLEVDSGGAGRRLVPGHADALPHGEGKIRRPGAPDNRKGPAREDQRVE